MSYLKKIKAIYIFLMIYFIINILFLTAFPFIHSDESWLSGLSRNIMEQKSFSVTEPFFDLYPRHPHAIKIIFHVIQIVFLKIFGYNIFTFRLISLIAGMVTLYFFYKLSLHILNNKILALMSVILLGLDIQFIYASHFARQEIILLMIMITGLYYYFINHNINFNNNCQTENNYVSLYPDIITGLIIGLAIGIHPNSFIIALPLVFTYIYYLNFTDKIKFEQFLAFIITLTTMAVIFIILSFSYDPDFLHNYASYGQTLGVFSSLTLKLKRLKFFYLKLFYGVSGTYYLPAIKLQFFLFTAILIYSLIRLVFNKSKIILLLLLTIFAINTGYVLIGRYNQTGIIFVFPFFYLLLITSINASKINAKKISTITFTALFIIVISINTGINLYSDTYFSYNNYLSEISKSGINRNSTVLANLNCEYYFENGNLYDYRNLAYLDENNLSFEDYIEKNEIEYIIYPQEMDLIYQKRPVWNILYGNVYPYYKEMKNYFDNNCQLIYKFSASTYGMRIVRYIGERDWKVKVYRVK